jgi:hypothetical protein
VGEPAIRRHDAQRVLPGLIYDVAYCARAAGRRILIKNLKNALCSDRLSCRRFVANAFRLLLCAIAYRRCCVVRHGCRRGVRRVPFPLP